MAPINDIIYMINPLVIVFVVILVFMALGIYYAVWQIGVSNDTTKGMNETLGEIKDEIKKINEDKEETTQPKDFRSRDTVEDTDEERLYNYIKTISSKYQILSQVEKDLIEQRLKSIAENEHPWEGE